MKLLKVDSVTEVQKKLKEQFGNIENSTEKVSLREAVGRYLAKDVFSDMDMPSFRRSVVDGYAIRGKDTFGVSESVPVFLEVKGYVNMGEKCTQTVEAGEAIYIPTGGMVPEGADSVVMIEYVEKLDEKTIAVYKPTPPGAGIMNQGDDFSKEAALYKIGKKIKTKDVGIFAASGNAELEVFGKPVVSIISTGDEIVDIHQVPQIGQIRDINTYTIAALAEELGCEIHQTYIINDDEEKFKKTIKEEIKKSDMVIISGGSSAGMKDMTVDVLAELGNPGVFTHGIAIKPGKPTILASIDGVPVFGLPGHPVSAIVVFQAVVAEFIKTQYFKASGNDQKVMARVTGNVHAGEGRETYQFVNLQKSQDGSGYDAIPIYAKSGAISQMMKADGYIKIDSLKEGIKEGESAEVILM